MKTYILILFSLITCSLGAQTYYTHTQTTSSFDFYVAPGNSSDEFHLINASGVKFLTLHIFMVAVDWGEVYISAKDMNTNQNIPTPSGFIAPQGETVMRSETMTVPNNCELYLMGIGEAYIEIVYEPVPIYSFSYDDAGNRVSRTMITFKSAGGESFWDPEKMGIDQSSLPLESLEDYLAGRNLKIYPNPTRGEMAIEFVDFPENEKVQVSLYDINGSLILDETVESQFYLLDIEDKPNGNYILKLSLGKFQKTYQIVKQ